MILKLLILFCVAFMASSSFCSGAENASDLQRTLDLASACMENGLYSFARSPTYPPTTIDRLRDSCKTQTAAFKCVKERAKNLPAILKRGLLSLVQARQRHHKKYCSNLNGELSRKFVNDLKCILDKKLEVYNRLEMDFARSLDEIRRRNYDDPKPELNYLCCSVYDFRRKIVDNAGPECNSSRDQLTEMIFSVFSNDVTVICEDEETLVPKTCLKLEPLSKTFNRSVTVTDSPVLLAMYIVATLGERA